MNNGLDTLQFISLSVSPFDNNLINGGTQDNGTWQTDGNTTTWKNIMIGDGGWSGFDVAKRNFRMHTFFDASPEVNFDNGDIDDWIWTADPIYGQPGTQFYAPIITDPVVAGTMFAGTGRSVYRTTTYGLGDRAVAEAPADLQRPGTAPSRRSAVTGSRPGLVPLTDAAYGDRDGGNVAAVERSSGNRTTAWAATATGRLFLYDNVAAANLRRVTWRRVTPRHDRPEAVREQHRDQPREPTTSPSCPTAATAAPRRPHAGARVQGGVERHHGHLDRPVGEPGRHARHRSCARPQR